MVKDAENLLHLIDDKVRKLSMCSMDERIDSLRQDQWYNLDFAAKLVAMLQELMANNRRNIRTACRRVIAPSGMAKSFILRQFEKQHPPQSSKLQNRIVYPVVMLEIPSDPNVKSLMERILTVTNLPVPRESRSHLFDHVIKMLKHMQVELIILDEFQRIHWASDKVGHLVCEAARAIAGELHIPVVVAGTNQMTRFFLSDEQLSSRFHPFEIAPWTADQAFLKAVSTILSYMPLRDPPADDIFTAEAVPKLLTSFGDRTDDIISVLKAHVIACLEEGEERLTLDRILSGHRA